MNVLKEHAWAIETIADNPTRHLCLIKPKREIYMNILFGNTFMNIVGRAEE